MRYIIGIDLGTTNSCVSYIDKEDPQLAIHPFKVLQLIAPGYVEARSTLPSFCYLSQSEEWPAGSLKLPWNRSYEHFVGVLAQSQGAKVPTRLIQSAKSWLCHAAAHRKEKILPSEASSNEQKISPVEATSYYLKHIKEAWNHLMAKSDVESEFEQQEIVLTVPASFDEVARRLTVEAAKAAGYVNLTLLEEPQAAFYSWLSLHEDHWKQILKEGDVILVCDVGGGTTDFSLIEVQESDHQLGFKRMSVGDHLLLGGDNMDATLAYHLEKKILKEYKSVNLSITQSLQLKHQARVAKEILLDEKLPSSESYNVLLQGIGSSVVKGSLSTHVSKEEVSELLLKGFFGHYDLEDALEIRKSTGFKTMGLPYEEEPSITKHLAVFLKKAAIPHAPRFILFNGGAMKPPLFQQAILRSLQHWYPDSQTQLLESLSLDLAVARGASYYGKVRQGWGIRIGGGSPKTYYLGVDIKKSDGTFTHQALTILPRGSEEGSAYESSQTFFLRPNTPVSFTLFTSNVRLQDQQGDLIEIDPKELQPLPAIQTILRIGKKQVVETSQEMIPVKLHIQLTAIGTLEIWLQSLKTEHRWSLEFQIRTAAGQENSVSTLDISRKDEIFDSSYLKPAQEYIKTLFESPSKAEKIMEVLENSLNKTRREWSLSVLRGLFDTILALSNKRKVNPELEARWWNLAGFFLRPGFGYPLDDFRVKELWKIILADFKVNKTSECQIQQWICFRRISGGLNKGQQTQLTNDILQNLLPNKASKIVLKAKSDLYPYTEKMRAIASFELIDISTKIRLGNLLLERILFNEAQEADFWSLGRLGARHLIYGTIAHVVPVETNILWIQKLLKLPPNEKLFHLFVQLARKTEERELNLPKTSIDAILAHFANFPDLQRLEQLLTQSASLTLAEQEEVFGDKLPTGLVIEQI
ncbi:MAG: molecular chaperone DnaK [Chlamydiales bacterium 38-26]|nr:Hsp70 family protein [Chlamydiales bacterium]OJV11002.1 MAG: molecular chaperone DnaK [Chlamydiales bacterium 38-26]